MSAALEMVTPHNDAHVTAQGAPAPPDAVLMQMLSAPLVTQALRVVAELGIADLLANGARGVDELAAETNTHAPSLYRFMRALAGCGVFAETEGGIFELTPAAELLRTGVEGSMRDIAIFMGADWHWQVWGDAPYTARTGRAAWEHVHGKEVFPYFAENTGAARVFDNAMTSLSKMVSKAVVEAYDFSSIRKLADIAGGHGSLLAAILRANPHLKGLLFDVPQVIEGAQAYVEAEGVGQAVELASGDFFESVPAGADAYMMKHIIHDWDDRRALSILRNCHRAMPADGKLLLVEMVVPAGNEPHFAKIQDLEMMLSPGGLERTEGEYRELFTAAGFELTRIIPTASPMSVIEGVKIKAR
ncbi:MAG TPA: methyltransferase [Pyrinomonadaceae bacterium]|jgi:ubiquinone/menaquinone biosynthesis C-methylase UbiE